MSTEKSEPRVIEVSTTVSVGGKVQIVKYEHSQDYFFSLGGRWEIPDDWTDEEADEFRLDRMAELREQLEEPSQKAIDEMIDMRDGL